MADESNPGPEGPSTCGTPVGGCRFGRRDGSGFAHSTFSLCLADTSRALQLASPCRAVLGKRFPRVEVDVQALGGRFEAVFKALLLSTN